MAVRTRPMVTFAEHMCAQHPKTPGDNLWLARRNIWGWYGWDSPPPPPRRLVLEWGGWGGGLRSKGLRTRIGRKIVLSKNLISTEDFLLGRGWGGEGEAGGPCDFSFGRRAWVSGMSGGCSLWKDWCSNPTDTSR